MLEFSYGKLSWMCYDVLIDGFALKMNSWV